MNLRMGSQTFIDVQVPLLWGTRAVVQDTDGRLSVIDLSGERARLEILADAPAPGVKFVRTVDGFVVRRGTEDLYLYSPTERSLKALAFSLPTCQITADATRIGSNVFSGNLVEGYAVGIAVTEHGMSFGGPLPRGLARLVL